MTTIIEAMRLNIDEFKIFIDKNLKENKDYLKEFFFSESGHTSTQLTILNYLILNHEEQKKNDSGSAWREEKSAGDLTAHIEYVLSVSKDANIGEPIHQALELGKFKLAYFLLGAEEGLVEHDDSVTLDLALTHLKNPFKFDLNRRDHKGRTLIYLILENKNFELLIYIIAAGANIHAATRINSRVACQPLHQAITLNFCEAVSLLAQCGARLSNPISLMKNTPLIQAARLGRIDILQALLEFPVQRLALESQNRNTLANDSSGFTAIEELCQRLASDTDTKASIRGIAMLLCRGAEPPRPEDLRTVLTNNRVDLLKAIENYLADKPDLVDDFVARCHLADSPLHGVLYADHSWGNSMRRLFGVPSEVAFKIEDLITRKYDALQDKNSQAIKTIDIRTETNTLKLYAEFVRSYTKTYNNQIFTNRWSTMRWMIAEGNCNWEGVIDYAKKHPTSRTKMVLDGMCKAATIVEEEKPSELTEETANVI